MGPSAMLSNPGQSIVTASSRPGSVMPANAMAGSLASPLHRNGARQNAANFAKAEECGFLPKSATRRILSVPPSSNRARPERRLQSALRWYAQDRRYACCKVPLARDYDFRLRVPAWPKFYWSMMRSEEHTSELQSLRH